MRRTGALAIACAMAWVLPAHADTAEREAAALAASQGAIGTVLPADLRFVSTTGATLTSGDLRGRPLVVSLVYTGCIDVCPLVIDNLRPALEIAADALGPGSFSAVTVGFDVRNDTPDRLRAFARERGADLDAWQFLATDATTLDRLAAAIGFAIEPSAGGFDHMAQVTILDAEGRIYRHVYGGAFEPPAIVEPLKELVYGRQRPVTSLAGLIDRVRLFCTVYSPNTGRYYFDYSMFIGLAIGFASLAGVLAWVIREFRRPRLTA